MQLRNRPFGEWILVYYDKSQVTEQKLLEFTKTRGCKRAAIIREKEVKAGSTKATVINPYICAGDVIAVQISSNGKEKISLELPEGWKAEIPATVDGTKTFFIQTSKTTGQGKKVLKLKSGNTAAELVCNSVRKI